MASTLDFCTSSLQNKQKFIAVALVISMAIGMFVAFPNVAFAKANPKYASIVMDADSGLILSQSNANKVLHPASLTKMMTLLMTFEAIDRGVVTLNDRVRISTHAASMVPSKLDLPVGSTIRLKDAIHILVTKSANDIAVALGEHVGGSEREFARLMTKRAHELGMSRTVFRNASGLHNRGQVSTARDMAKLARIIISDYPGYYKYFARRSFTYRGKTYRNHNKLMSSYKGMDGMKTGYVYASGFNLVSSAVQNNQRLIGVVFGGRTSKSRNAHMRKILDNGFTRLNTIRIAHAKVPLPPHKPGILLAMASLNDMKPASGSSVFDEYRSRLAGFNPVAGDQAFASLIGEGDIDPAAVLRIETGLLAVAAHKGQKIPSKYRRVISLPAKAAFTTTTAANDALWAIQVGAFKSRSKTDKVIAQAMRDLPLQLANVSPSIAPLNKDGGWIFRGRLNGYTKDQARKACAVLDDCMTVPPQGQ